MVVLLCFTLCAWMSCMNQLRWLCELFFFDVARLMCAHCGFSFLSLTCCKALYNVILHSGFGEPQHHAAFFFSISVAFCCIYHGFKPEQYVCRSLFWQKVTSTHKTKTRRVTFLVPADNRVCCTVATKLIKAALLASFFLLILIRFLTLHS